MKRKPAMIKVPRKTYAGLIERLEKWAEWSDASSHWTYNEESKFVSDAKKLLKRKRKKGEVKG